MKKLLLSLAAGLMLGNTFVSNAAAEYPEKPITIVVVYGAGGSGDTTIRAIATKPGWLPTNVDTQTYIFVDDVAQQPSDPAGWDSDWGFDSQAGAIVPSDYEMDPRVVNNTNGLGVYTIREALLDLPTVSIAMPQDDFTGPGCRRKSQVHFYDVFLRNLNPFQLIKLFFHWII